MDVIQNSNCDMGDSQDSDPFLVTPETDEYDALGFLVRNRGVRYSPFEIASRTDISEANASKTLTHLSEEELVEHDKGTYYVDPDRAEHLKNRLESVDAAVRLFEAAPDDDAYAEPGWEDHVPSIDKNGKTESETTGPDLVEDPEE